MPYPNIYISCDLYVYPFIIFFYFSILYIFICLKNFLIKSKTQDYLPTYDTIDHVYDDEYVDDEIEYYVYDDFSIKVEVFQKKKVKII